MPGRPLTGRSARRTRALLLDLYGTLVEPDWEALEAGRAALAAQLSVSADAAGAAWAATHRRRMRGEYGSLESDIAGVFASATAGTVSIEEDVLRDFAARERDNWRAGVRLYDDVLPVLQQLHAAGVTMALVTNASSEAACVIPHLGLEHLLEFVLVSCEAGILKPELLDHARLRLGVAAGETMLVDDDVEQLAAASAMGMQTVVVRRGGRRAEHAAPDFSANYEVGGLNELPRLVLAPGGSLRR